MSFVEEEEVLSAELPRDVEYVRIAAFAYDIHAPNSVQRSRFPDVKTGCGLWLVVLKVRANWGRGFTCLYASGCTGRRCSRLRRSKSPPHYPH